MAVSKQFKRKPVYPKIQLQHYATELMTDYSHLLNVFVENISLYHFKQHVPLNNEISKASSFRKKFDPTLCGCCNDCSTSQGLFNLRYTK